MNKYIALYDIVNEIKESDFRNKLILIQGCSGSGKSTFATDLIARMSEVVDDLAFDDSNFDKVTGDIIREYIIPTCSEADNFWSDTTWSLNSEYKFDPKFLDYAHMQCLGEAAYNLYNYGIAIVANIFTSDMALSPYYTLAERMGADIILVKMATQYDDVHNVPEQAKRRMRQQLEAIKDTYKPDYIIDSDEQI